MTKCVTWVRRVIDKGLWEPFKLLLTKYKVILPKIKAYE